MASSQASAIIVVDDTTYAQAQNLLVYARGAEDVFD